MRVTVAKAAALGFWRDKAALALTLLLPPLIYLVFASVFGATGTGDLQIRLALYRDDTAMLTRFEETLGQQAEISAIIHADTPQAVIEHVRRGTADAGLAMRSNGARAAPDFDLYTAGTREAAGLIAEQALARLRPDSGGASAGGNNGRNNANARNGATLTRQSVEAVNEDHAARAYYAAGVSLLFVFLAGFQSALSLFDERAAGVYERFAVRPGAIAAAIDGKTLFIAGQSFLQIAVILAVAAMTGVTLTHAPLILFVSAVIIAFAASGLVIGLTSLCRSRGQAHAAGIVITLLFGALGGSMAPRFVMPTLAREVGALTPNGLGIDALAASLWSGGGWQSALVPLSILSGLGCAGWLIGRIAGPSLLTSDMRD